MHLCFLFTVFALTSSGLAFTEDEGHQLVIDQEFETASTIRDELLANEIIGDVLDDFEPTYYIDVAYAEAHERVLLGNDIPTKAVKNRPTFTFHSINAATQFDTNSTFTLILTDPDAKSRANPKWSEVCHWILTNLTTPIPEPPPAINKKKSKKLAGELVEYLPPGPPPKTGKHRYVFVLLQGDVTNITAPKKRFHWGYKEARHGVRDWAGENNLTVVGANFFFAQNKKQKKQKKHH